MYALVVVLLSTQVVAGGERENQLRYLQTLGAVPMYPWGVRAFSSRETDSLDRPAVRPSGRQWLPITASVRYNSTFPYGFNDQAIWAGKGLTLAAEGGFAWRHGVLSLTLDPLLFVAQNAEFTLMANGASGDQAYADGSMGGIDRPQRFGDDVYARLDPGQSTLRIDWRKLTVGVTTANQYWGPASEFPFLLGNNAPGFPQLFIGTARPIDLKLFRLHSRLIWGRLGQSAFAPASSAAPHGRLATGIIADFTFGWLPGLELGAARFAHSPWREGGPTLDDWLTIFKTTEQGLGASNQLASVFLRWVLPRSGFEVYGEYGKDDYNSDGRGFILEPDHLGGYMVGFRKAMRRPGDRMLAVRAEVQNLQISSLAQGRVWVPFYTHGTILQGHTQLGQVLGSEAGPGGAGSVVALESFSPQGRWTWAWTRMIRQQRGDQSGTTADPNGVDVQHALSVERMQKRGGNEVVLRVTGVYELNRNFSYDAFNLNVIAGLRLFVR